MQTIRSLKVFITEEQILECAILFQTRKMDAAKLLRSYMYNKWVLTTLEAVKILENN